MSGRSLRPWRKRVAGTAGRMAELGLVHWSSGNVSVRVGDRIVITPSGIPYQRLQPRQVAVLNLACCGSSHRGEPSSEWRLHAALYRARPDVRAVVHTHSPAATVAACRGQLQAATHEARIFLGESIPVSKPAPPGSWELAHEVSRALAGGPVVLVGEHGAVAVAETLERALALAVMLEEAARMAQALCVRSPGKEG